MRRRSAVGAILVLTCALLIGTSATEAGAASPSTIAGTVTSSGAALAHACVTAVSQTTNMETSTTTAHNGTYTLTVSPDSYQVRFDDCGGAAGDYITAYYQQPGDATATTISVVSGQSVTGIDATLTPAGSISGQLTDAASGSQLAGACVSVWPAGSGSDGTVQPTASVATGATGSYQVRRLLPGAYDVRFDTLGECAGSSVSAHSVVWNPNADAETGALPIDVAAESDTPAGQTAMPAASITGWVGGSRVAAVCVRAFVDGSDAANVSPTGEAVTDFAGKYAISGLPTGMYDVQFETDGGCPGGVWGGYVPQWYNQVLTQAASFAIPVSDGSPATGIAAVLMYGGVVSGTVVDAASGLPLRDICVTPYDVGSSPMFSPVRTDAQGNYTLWLSPGTYDIAFADCMVPFPQRLTEYWQETVDAAAATPLTVEPGGSLTDIDAAMSYPQPPDAPLALTAVGGLKQVALSWQEPTNSGDFPVDYYDVYRSEPSLGSVLVSSQVETAYVDTDLSDATSYSYQVFAVSEAGEGTPASASAKTWSLPAAPALSAPTVVPNQVQLSWTAPNDDGGTPITGYNVYRSTLQGTVGTQIASGVNATSYVDAGLPSNAVYYYRVRAVNPVGQGPSSAPQRAVLRSAPPTVTITESPPTSAASSSATFAFVATNPLAGALSFSCVLDGSSSSPCSSPTTYAGLADGSHTFSVLVTDASGKTATAKTAWTVDTTAPSPSMASMAPFQPGQKIVVAVGTIYGQFTSVDVRYRSARWNAGFGTFNYPAAWQNSTLLRTSLLGSPGHTYCLSVRARDSLGNVSAWSAEQCTTLPLDDRVLSKSAGWTRGTGKGYVAGTWTETTKHGAKMTLSGAQVRRAAVFFRRCPGCGSVAVYVGGHYWKTVYTASKLTPQPWWLILPSRALSTGSIVLKVVSSGKPVYIDGLGVSRV